MATAIAVSGENPCPGIAFGSYSGTQPYDGGVPRVLDTGDLNADGLVDAVISGGSGALLYAGMPDGSFAAPQLLDSIEETYANHISDLDGDGYDDLVVMGVNKMAIRYNDQGVLAAPILFDIETSAQGLGYIETADMDADGFRDILVSTYNRDRLLIYHGGGSRQFDAPVSIGINDCFGLAVADIDQDGFDDVAVVSEQVNDIVLVYGRPDRLYAPGSSHRTLRSPRGVAIADIDDDGFLDLISNSAADTASINIFYGSGNRAFASNDSFAAPFSYFAGPTSPVVTDLDDDGHMDITPGVGISGASILLGVGNRNFLPLRTYGDAPVIAISLVADDLNGNGRDDILVATWFTPFNSLATIENLCDQLCSGADLAEPLGVQNASDITTFVEYFVATNSIADLNRDENLDLADIVSFVAQFDQDCDDSTGGED